MTVFDNKVGVSVVGQIGSQVETVIGDPHFNEVEYALSYASQHIFSMFRVNLSVSVFIHPFVSSYRFLYSYTHSVTTLQHSKGTESTGTRTRTLQIYSSVSPPLH